MECSNKNQVKELLELHEEVLIKILEYVPRRNDCHLVSHRFNFLCNLVQGVCLNLKPEPQLQDEMFYKSILETERNISKIVINDENGTFNLDTKKLSQIFQLFGMTLKHLEMRDCHISDKELVDILHDVPNIKSLILNNTDVTDAAYDAICKLSSLKTLELNLDTVSRDEIHKLSNLTKLTDLNIDCDNNNEKKQIQELSLIENPKLMKLVMTAAIRGEDVIKIMENNPNLKIVNIKDYSKIKLSVQDFVNQISKLEELKFSAYDVIFQEPVNGRAVEFPPNPQLKILFLGFTIPEELLSNLIPSYPNLEQVTLTFPVTTNILIRKLLQSLPKLKYLMLHNCDTITVDIFDSIKQYGLNLQRICLSNNKISAEEIDNFVKYLGRPLEF
ncbi:unnamed protein product [Diamesa hyperborea]